MMALAATSTAQIAFTQNADSTTIVPFNSVVLGSGSFHGDSSYGRSYDTNNLALFAPFNTTGVAFGVERARAASGSQPYEIRFYADSHGGPSVVSPYEGLTLLASKGPFNLGDRTLRMAWRRLWRPVLFRPNGVDRLVIEIFTPDGRADGNLLIIGSNNRGQSNDTFIAAPGHGLENLVSTAEIGAPDMHLVQVFMAEQIGSADGARASPTYPGTGEDFVILSAIDNLLESALDRKTGLVAGSMVRVRVASELGTFDGDPVGVLGEVFATGLPPDPIFPGLAVSGDPSSTVVVAGWPAAPPGTPTFLPSSGLALSFPMPASLVGVGASVMIQGLVSTPEASNGLFASTDGHEFTDGF